MQKEKKAARDLWNKSPAGTTHAIGSSLSSKELFEKVREKRNTYEIPTVLDLIPFSKFKEKKILELGSGQGFDAYEFCQQGAEYTGIDIAPNNIERAQKHLSHFGLKAKFLNVDVENLPFDDCSFDGIYSNGVLHHTPNMEKSFRKAHRVLKEGGDFYVILYNKHSIFYWLNLFLYYHIFKRGFLKETMKERLSKIEYSSDKQTSDVLVNVYTKKNLKQYLKKTGFQVSGIWVRKLNREDFPGFPLLNKIWPHLSSSLLQKLEKRFGWYLIAHGKKLGSHGNSRK